MNPLRPRRRCGRPGLLAALALAALPAVAGDAPADRVVLFGDLHIHTSLSTDAFGTGNRTLPDDAYRFAQGETIRHGAGFDMRLGRPLDFAAVTDHAEYLGVVREFANPASDMSRHPLAKLFASEDPADAMKALFQVSDDASKDGSLTTLMNRPPVIAGAWRTVIESAERHNRPGRFTTLIGFEWTSTPNQLNLHRNVIFRTARVPDAPYTRLDSERPEDLWNQLDAWRADGIEAMAIPHNSNASDGRMWSVVDSDGKGVTRAWAEQRLRDEPVAEITQIKGTSETHPALSPADEFAGFELWTSRMAAGKVPPPSRPHGSYARDALKTGLQLGERLGINPYRFALIGSTDTHNSGSQVEEDNFKGKLPRLDGTPAMRMARLARAQRARELGVETSYSAAGLAAVWSESNTREAIYDALRRRETYATTGTRLRVRLFAGWDWDASRLEGADAIARAYADGAPMGGVLSARSGAAAPALLVHAARDPLGANLDRVQVVKGWLDADGSAHEKVFDVAWSGARNLDPASGRLPPVGSTVDVRNARYTNTIGTQELRTVWTDPAFDPARPAFYYVRVLEIPTPRWSTYDAKLLGVPAPQPAEIQERAFTSPIWYEPPRG